MSSADRKSNRKKRHHADYGPPPWWVKEFGGLPGWALVVAGIVFIGIGAVIVYALTMR